MTESYDTGAEPIAIVGMALRVPGAGDVQKFWTNLLDGVESVTVFDADEQRARGASEAELADPYFVPAAPVLDAMEYFDAPLFGMSPREAETADPQQRIFLELAHTVLSDAGCDPARYPGEIAVYAGTGSDEYLWRNLRSNRRYTGTTANLSLSIGNHPDYIATMVSYRLSLRGPSLTLHTACSTSLVAVHLACEALRGGECDMALAGGVCVELPHGKGYMAVGGFTTSDGHCRPFDANADGTIWGSGAGLVALKRLSDAVADGDDIKAVILGNAINNDGAAKVGFSAPSVEGQAEAVAQALGVAGIDPRSIGYVEAHGTGTALGDPIEVAALTRVYAADTTDTDWCAIGSVKSNFGHLSQAAGVVGLIKAALALDHGIIPPTINFSEPNPAIDFKSSPFYVAATLSRWDNGNAPRRAAVSSFGIGGTNAHVVLEQAPAVEDLRTDARPVELLRVSARTESALITSAGKIADHLEANPRIDLGSVAHTLHFGRAEYARRAFVLAGDPAEAAAVLRDAKKLVRGQAVDPAPLVALLFSGQGSQYPGMGQRLYQAEPVFARVFDQCCDVLLEAAEPIDLRAIVAGDSAQASVLTDTRYAQPALFALEYALASLWQAWGVTPAAMIGHSIGEYVAAAVAGVFTPKDALHLVALRGKLMSQMPAGSMCAVQLGEAEVAERLPTGLCIAVVNGPGTCVVAGPGEAVSGFAEDLKAEKVRATVLRTSHAFHSPMMEPVVDEFAAAVARTSLAPPTVPFLSNASGDWITDEQATDPRYWAAQLRDPVLFGACVSRLAQAASETNQTWALLECGPGRQLAGLVRMQIPQNWPRPLPSLPGTGEKAEDFRVFLGAAGRLWLAGVPIGDSAAPGSRRVVPLPGYPYERVRHWVDPDQPTATSGATQPPADLAAAPRPVADWFAVPTWRQAPPLRTAVPSGRFVVFVADRRGEELVAALRDHELSVVTVRPGPELRADADCWHIRVSERDDYDALLAGLASDGDVPDRIVHAWALADDPAGHDVAAAWAAQEHGFFSLLRLGQAMAAAPKAPPRLDVLVAGTQDVRGDDLRQPEHATTAGITRVLPLELHGVKAARIDLDPAGTPVGQLLAELAADPAAETVALRGGRRWLTEFAEITLPEPEESLAPQAEGRSTALRDGGRYLITGGLGGIGLTLASDLARRCRPRLVLLSRTGLPPRAEWDTLPDGGRVSAAVAEIREMERSGAQVHVMAADVCDVGAMDRLSAQVAELLGGLDGIIHAAGVPGGGMAEVKDEAVAKAVLEPKLAGTLVLLRSFGPMTQDFIALCSSVTAIVGGVGQVDYCAANAFLDAVARADHGLRAKVVSLNWGGWGEVGMLAKAMSDGDERGERPLDVDHPLLRTAVEAGELRRADGHISAGTDWVLDEHRLSDVPVLPGTAHLELARAVANLGSKADDDVVELSDVVFIEPFAVSSAADLSVTLDRGDFRVTSGRKIFSHGSARLVQAGSSQIVDLAAIRARCRPVPEASWRAGRTSVITFGARWDCLRQAWTGDDEELALIEAPPQVAAELDRWVLHPALLDVATAFGISKREGAYLPLSYGRVIVRGRLPGRFYSYMRQETAAEGVLSSTVTICDEEGRELVAISDFTLRRVELGSVGGLHGDHAAGPSPVAARLPRRGAATLAGRPGEGLISPADGATAFRMVLAADPAPQVAVTPVGLPAIAARITRTSSDVAEGGVTGEAGEAGEAGGAGVTDRHSGSLEDQLIRIWADLLGVEPAGPSDDFFELGGNSLIAVGLIGTIREAVGVRLPMRILFEAPTVAGLAVHIRRMLAEKTPDERVEEAQADQIPALPRPAR